jgi:hypothetical protein
LATLGNRNLDAGNGESAGQARLVRQQKARERAVKTLPFIAAAKAAGCSTLRQVAEALQNRGVRAPGGGTRWHAASVSQIEKLAALPNFAERAAVQALPWAA